MNQTNINKCYKRDSKLTRNGSSSKYYVKGRNRYGVGIKTGLTKQFRMVAYHMAQPDNSLGLTSQCNKV